MNEKSVIALRKHSGTVRIDGVEIRLDLPEGATGILFCFKSKKAAKEFWGNDVQMVEYEDQHHD